MKSIRSTDIAVLLSKCRFLSMRSLHHTRSLKEFIHRDPGIQDPGIGTQTSGLKIYVPMCEGDFLGRVAVKGPNGSDNVVRGSTPNGTNFAAGNHKDGVMGACTVMYQVGSRNEVCDDLGATHFVRVGSTLGGSRFSGFFKNRILQQQGVRLSVRSDRQSLAFTMSCPRFLFFKCMDFLIDTGVNTQFHDYEIEELRSMVRGDLSQRSPEQHVLDLLQKASFSGSMANSVYCEEERIGEIKADALTNFMRLCGPSNCSIGSWGLPPQRVQELAANLPTIKPLEKSRLSIASRHRSGFEHFDTGPGSTTYIALSVPSAGAKDFETYLSYCIVAHACGYGLPVTYGVRDYTASSGPLSCFFSPKVACKAFNIGYLDTGIFGLLLQTPAEYAHCLSLQLSKFFHQIIPTLSEEDFAKGKKRLMLAMSQGEQSCELAAMGLAMECALGGSSVGQKEVESVTNSELKKTVQAIGQKCKDGAMSVAVLGDVTAVPIPEELKHSTGS